MNVVFLGPPGSGKGTQGKKLADAFGLTHLSTGNVFREAIKSQTELGKEIAAFVENGKLVPDHLVSAVVFEKLKKLGASKPFILDGYPRTLGQAKELDNFQSRESIPIDAIADFAVKPDLLVKRLSARRECPNCKEVFNLETRRPAVDGKCDNCSEALIQRVDDREDVIRQRLNVYDLQTAPIIDYFKNRTNFFSLDAAQSMDQVYEELVKGLERLGLAVH